MAVNLNDDEELLHNLKTLTKEQLIANCEDLILSNKKLENELKTMQASNDGVKKKTKKKEHKQREFDFSKYGTRRMAFKFLYLGWDYQGLASQENTTNTIEGELFTALTKSKLIENRSTVNYSRCGRTDKGVSAFGQVIALDVRSNMPSECCNSITLENEDQNENEVKRIPKEELPYVQILNRLLPPDIRIVAYAPVGVDFDARFSCKTRRYKYYFPASNLDIELMHTSAQNLVGENDFRNFCKVDVGNNVNHFIRNVVSFNVKRIDNTSSPHDMCEMEITGLAFLWHQVRCMAAVLLLIGLHLEEPSVIEYLLDIEKCPKRPQYNMASEYPLVLYDCFYDNIRWVYEREFNEPTVNRIQQLWTKKVIESTMIRSMVNDLTSQTSLNTSPSHFQISAILPCFHKDNYKVFSKRSVCEGLDRHMEKLAAKRLKLEEKYSNS